MTECAHPRVLVDYAHPHGVLAGIAVAELRASDPKSTRPIMQLENPRCADCGAAISRKQLADRVDSGDLHDARFLWRSR